MQIDNAFSARVPFAILDPILPQNYGFYRESLMPSSENRGEGLLRRLQVLGLCSMERGQNRRGLIEALRSVKRLTDIHANNPFEFSALCGTMGQSLILQGVIFGWD